MKKITYSLFGYLLILLVLNFSAGCKQVTNQAEETPAKESSVNHLTSETSEKTSENISQGFEGKVVETTNAGRYTYV